MTDWRAYHKHCMTACCPDDTVWVCQGLDEKLENHITLMLCKRCTGKLMHSVRARRFHTYTPLRMYTDKMLSDLFD